MNKITGIEGLFHEILKFTMFGIGGIVFIVLFFISAGYGRYATNKWGPKINPKLGWVIMECVSPLMFFSFFIFSTQTDNLVAWVFVGIWELHYIQRAFIYPFLLRSKTQMPILIVGMGLFFNIINSYLQGRFLFLFRSSFSVNWLYDIRFLLGFTIFIIGFVINLQSDYILRHLRKPGESDYKIPKGGLFEYVSCPNYFGELLEWIGWAILTWSISGLVFAFWTAANLIPRAISHHKWYHLNFSMYPKNRKVFFPFFI